MEGLAADATLARLLWEAEASLRQSGIDTPRLDAEVLLGAALRADRAALYRRLAEPVSHDVATRFRSAVERRRGREPVAYLTGVREFWSLPFVVTPDVLIPRPETELLVAAACRLLAGRARPAVCDVGTGSGCVAVAIARELPEARILATDLSPRALAVAEQNAVTHGVSARITFACGGLFAGTDPAARFDLVVSNPPYVSTRERLSPEVAWEPRSALVAGADGLGVIGPLLAAAPARLRDGGWLAMEFGLGQEAAVRHRAGAAGFRSLSVQLDLAGIPRVLVASMGDGGGGAGANG